MLTADGSGQVSWTFPTAFAAPPVVSASVVDPTAGDGNHYAVEVAAPSATGVTVRAVRLSSVTVLGVSVLASTVAAAGASVHVMAIAAS